MELKNSLYFIIIILNIIESISIDIHPLNEINQACNLEINKSIDYYFYTSITNVKNNEQISYFVSSEITKFNISYYFLEKDNYQNLTDSDINKFTFNETLGFLDYGKFFKIIFKTSDKYKGLLLKMRIISHQNSGSNLFEISKINLTYLTPPDITISMPENKTYYFYINYYYFLQYDIFVFTSYGNKTIKEFIINSNSYNPEINEYSRDNFLFVHERRYTDSILKLKTYQNENIFINIKFLPNNTLIEKYDDYSNLGIEQIQLSLPNSGYHEIYFIKNDKHFNYFLREISGKYEASYIYI